MVRVSHYVLGGLLVGWLTSWPTHAHAEISATFFARESGRVVYGERIGPHAFVHFEGAVYDGRMTRLVDDYYGFGPFEDLGWLGVIWTQAGEIEDRQAYLENYSRRSVTVNVSDQTYFRIIGGIKDLQSKGAPGYNSLFQNCVGFAKGIASDVGIAAGRSYLITPESFVDALSQANPTHLRTESSITRSLSPDEQDAVTRMFRYRMGPVAANTGRIGQAAVVSTADSGISQRRDASLRRAEEFDRARTADRVRAAREAEQREKEAQDDKHRREDAEKRRAEAYKDRRGEGRSDWRPDKFTAPPKSPPPGKTCIMGNDDGVWDCDSAP